VFLNRHESPESRTAFDKEECWVFNKAQRQATHYTWPKTRAVRRRRRAAAADILLTPPPPIVTDRRAAAAADRMSASRRRRFRDVFTSCCTPAIYC